MRKILIIPNFVLWCIFYAMFFVPYLMIGRIRERNLPFMNQGKSCDQEN
ncbi:MAG: hypothetical protein RBS38_12705 [Bacteroidales bacterium]|jgi:hypothetical protein|nr:hypothetical protein [Bacteroidales bacterium]